MERVARGAGRWRGGAEGMTAEEEGRGWWVGGNGARVLSVCLSFRRAVVPHHLIKPSGLEGGLVHELFQDGSCTREYKALAIGQGKMTVCFSLNCVYRYDVNMM